MIAAQPIVLARLQAALHPLAATPDAAGWNLDDIGDLLPAQGVAAEAAVLLPVIARADGLHLLLTRRTDGLRQHGGQVSFPGGRIDATDANAASAALREAHEEIGLLPAQATLMGFLDPLATVTGYRVVPVVAGIDPAFRAVPAPAEVSAVFDVPLDWLMATDNLREIDMPYRGRARRVLEYRSAPTAPTQRIWGATASILFNLRQRLEALR